LLNVAAVTAAAADSDDQQEDDDGDEVIVGGANDDPRSAERLSTLLALPHIAARAGAFDVPTTSAHWHSHAVWCTAFAPNGSFLLSGGEEAVVVVWQVRLRNCAVTKTGAFLLHLIHQCFSLQLLPSGGGTGSAHGTQGVRAVGKGPLKSSDSMTFFARVGAPLRCIAAFAAADTVPSSASLGVQNDAIVRSAPPLMFSFSCVDNRSVLFMRHSSFYSRSFHAESVLLCSVALVNALTLRELWSVRGMSVCGLAALPPVGVVNSLSRYAHRNAMSRGLALSRSGGRYELAGDRGTLLHATTRYLRRGLVIDPRTRAVVLNGLPGRSTLQWYDLRKDSHAMEVEVRFFLRSFMCA
jgi:hypothetical protein